MKHIALVAASNPIILLQQTTVGLNNDSYFSDWPGKELEPVRTRRKDLVYRAGRSDTTMLHLPHPSGTISTSRVLP